MNGGLDAPALDAAMDAATASALFGDARVEALAKRGVAANWRGRVWSVALRLQDARSDAFARAGEALQAFYALPEPQRPGAMQLVHEQIQRDVTRTFPQLASLHHGFTRRLKNALLLHAHRPGNSDGYTQGLNYIVGGLLLFLDDAHDVFLALKHVVENVLPHYFSDGMSGVVVDTSLFNVMLQRFLPKLAAHFERIRLSTLLLTSQWFTCLFLKSLPLESAARVLNRIFLDNGITALFDFALRLLAFFETELLAIADDVDLILHLNERVAGLYDVDAVFDFELAVPIALTRANVDFVRTRNRRNADEVVKIERRKTTGQLG